MNKLADVVEDDAVWMTALAVVALKEGFRRVQVGQTDSLDKVTEYIHTTATTDDGFDLLINRA